MVNAWVSFPIRWSLPDVQAGLTVLIAFLCAGGIFVVVRWCWQLAARRVATRKEVPRYALLSLNTVGEAIDIIWLLRREIFQRRYHALLAQCLFVLLLTAATLLAGVIARSSTRHGHLTSVATVNGTIAMRGVSGLAYADVEVNQTLSNLQRTNFPLDRLLEFLPDSFSEWEYKSDEWNSTWSMSCQFRPETPITLPITNNCTNDVWSEIPSLQTLWSDKDWYQYYNDWQGWHDNLTEYKDVLMFEHGALYADYNSDFNISTNMTMRSIAIHMRGIPYNHSSDDCYFAEGQPRSAVYTSATCNLLRAKNITNENALYSAGPDNSDLWSLTSAMTQHWTNRMRVESARNQAVTMINGTELAQFYQAYTIVKDTAASPYVQRKLDKEFTVAQISLACLVVVCIGTALVVAGLIQYYVFWYRHRDFNTFTPQSKLDWFLQTVGHDGDFNSTRNKMRNSTVSSIAMPSETVPLAATDSNFKEGGSVYSLGPVAQSTPRMTNDGFERVSRGYMPDYRPGMAPRIGSRHSGYSELGPDRDLAMDTSYDPTRRSEYPVQPIEDGFFQGRWA